MTQVFVIHHNPNSGRYRYRADPNDAVASAKALLAAGGGRWVAGNCHRMIRVGDLLLFKFSGADLIQEPGIYAVGRVAGAPRRSRSRSGRWELHYEMERRLTQRLLRSPIIGAVVRRILPRSFGASIQLVPPRGVRMLVTLVGDIGAGNAITHGLLIRKQWIDKILAGTKTWEIRGKATSQRGPIALIESQSGFVVGTCNVADVTGPLTLAELVKNSRKAGVRFATLPYPTTYAWVLRDARRLPSPVPYRHPPGAVIWVRLQPSVMRRLMS